MEPTEKIKTENVFNLTMAEAVEKYNKHFETNLTVLHRKEIIELTKKEYGKMSSINILPGSGFQVWFTMYGVEHTASLLQVNFA